MLGRRLGRLRSEELLPVELPILLAGGPGFKLAATDLADDHLLLGQVNAGFAHVQALQAHQGTSIRRFHGKGRDADGGVAQQ